MLPCTSLDDNFTSMMLVLLHVDVLSTFKVIFECKPNNFKWPFSLIPNPRDEVNYRAGALRAQLKMEQSGAEVVSKLELESGI